MSEKLYVLSFYRIEASDDDDAALTADGGALQVGTADTRNASSSSVEQRVAGTTSVIESEMTLNDLE